MPFPVQRRKGSDSTSPTQRITRTNDEAKLLVASCLRSDNALVSVRDGFLDVESMQIHLPRLAVLNARCPTRHSERHLTTVALNHAH